MLNASYKTRVYNLESCSFIGFIELIWHLKLHEKLSLYVPFFLDRGFRVSPRFLKELVYLKS